MNIILFHSKETSGNSIVFEDDRAKHIVKVLRLSVGDKIQVGLINDKIGYGVIADISRKQPYMVRVLFTLEQEPVAPSKVDLLLALPRPIMLKRILSQATSLGVKHFYVVNASRVEKSYWDSKIIHASSCFDYFLKGLSQSVDTMLPHVRFFRSFNSFLRTDLTAIIKKYDNLFIADPRYDEAIRISCDEQQGRSLLAIGPEGGWLDNELDLMMERGFRGIGLGSRILRVDTAVIALHSIVSQAVKTNRNS